MSLEEQQAMADHLNRAIEEIGSAAQLARMLAIQASAIAQWDRCPADHCREIEYRTDKLVTRYQLRPDIFGNGAD